MLRILLIVALLFFTAAHAQTPPEEILVTDPPRYSLGDTHDGSVYLLTEIVAKLHQTVIVGENGIPLIRGEHITADGKVEGYFLLNPSTMLGMSMSDFQEQVTLVTTCSMKKSYPIVLNKTYSCDSIRKTDDRVFTTTDTWEHKVVIRDEHNAIISICGTHVSSMVKKVTKIGVCLTPDGKWIDKIYSD